MEQLPKATIYAALITAAAILLAAVIGYYLHQTEKSYPDITIISPEEGTKIPQHILVKGTINGEIPEGKNIWLVHQPVGISEWSVEQGPIYPFNDQWSCEAWVGDLVVEKNKEFNIAIVLVDEEGNQELLEHRRTASDLGWPTIGLPLGTIICDKVTVLRE